MVYGKDQVIIYVRKSLSYVLHIRLVYEADVAKIKTFIWNDQNLITKAILQYTRGASEEIHTNLGYCIFWSSFIRTC